MNPKKRYDSFGHIFADLFVQAAREVYEEMQVKDEAKVIAPVSAEAESIVNDIMIAHIDEAIDKALDDRDEQAFLQLVKQKESLLAPTSNDSVLN